MAVNDEPKTSGSLQLRLSEWLYGPRAPAFRRGRAQEDDTTPVRPSRLKLIDQLIEKRVVERSGLLHFLHDVLVIAVEARTIDEAFRRVLTGVAEFNGWCFGHAYLVSQNDPDVLVRTRAYFEKSPGRFAGRLRAAHSKRLRRGEGLPGRVLESGEPVWVSDAAVGSPADDDGSIDPPRSASAAAFPVTVDGQVIAVFEFLSEKAIPPDKLVMESMADIGTHLGMFILSKRMKKRIAELSTFEQQRIGRDLHDDLGQRLTGAALLAKSLERDLRGEASAHAERAGEIARGLKEAQTHVRLLARGLAPVEIDARGLMKALDDLARVSSRRFERDVRFVARMESLVRNNGTATELYRIAQEAVTNAAKHGKATEITIGLSADDDEIELEIVDNGIGVSDRAIRRHGVGMSTMVFRARVIGGELVVERAPGGGAVVRCTVDNDEESADWEYTDAG